MPQQLIIVGAGQAAAQAIQTLRHDGFDGCIVLIGTERQLPYQRPPLSKKYLAGELPRERLSLRPESFYRDKRVELELGVAVERIEPATRRVHLADGRNLAYDHLLLATGSRARPLHVPGVMLPGVHYLRTLEDVDAMVGDFQPGRRLVLAGAGYIGLEAAAIARQRGLEVTALEAGDHVMSRVVCPSVAEAYQRYHAQNGVKIHCRTSVTAFHGRRHVESVETADGARHPCDLVIIGIGALPNTELAVAAGLPCNDGILVDEFGRTADPHILAAGDCTNHPHPLLGFRVRLESVQNAVEQAKAAASTLTGTPQAYDSVPWFWSDQYDLKLQIAGISHGYETTVIRGSPDDHSFAAFYLKGRRLLAVDAVNRPRDFIFGRKLIAARFEIDPDELTDPATDLTALAKKAEQASSWR